MFSPMLGRWIQDDPIEFEAGDPNLYRFVGNNPANRIDPTGLFETAPEPRMVLEGKGDAPDLGFFDPPSVRIGNATYQVPQRPKGARAQPDPVQFTAALTTRVKFKNTVRTMGRVYTEDVTVSASGWRRFNPVTHPRGGDDGDHIGYMVVVMQFRNAKCIEGDGKGMDLEDRWKLYGFGLPYGVFLRSVSPAVNTLVANKMVVEPQDTYESFVQRFMAKAQAIRVQK